jgi:hypothetical protein
MLEVYVEQVCLGQLQTKKYIYMYIGGIIYGMPFVHTTEPVVPDPSPFEISIVIAK